MNIWAILIVILLIAYAILAVFISVEADKLERLNRK